jgi:hypothetical protein
VVTNPNPSPYSAIDSSSFAVKPFVIAEELALELALYVVAKEG